MAVAEPLASLVELRLDMVRAVCEEWSTRRIHNEERMKNK